MAPEIDETKSIRTWGKKAADQLDKLNKDCNNTADLQALLKVAVGDIERVKGAFMVMKNYYVYHTQFPLILAYAVTIHKCQDLSLDCAILARYGLCCTLQGQDSLWAI